MSISSEIEFNNKTRTIDGFVDYMETEWWHQKTKVILHKSDMGSNIYFGYKLKKN